MMIAQMLSIGILLMPTMPIVQTQAEDWTGVTQSLTILANEWSRPRLNDAAASDQPKLVADEPLEMRAFCKSPASQVALALLHLECNGSSCSQDASASLAAEALDMAARIPAQLSADSQPTIFLPAGRSFADGPKSEAEALQFGAAADLRLRGITDPTFLLATSGDKAAYEQYVMLAFAWCQLTDRNRAQALDWIALNGFPSDTDEETRRIVPAIMYFILHAAYDAEAVSQFRAAAEVRFSKNKLSPYYFAQILDIERSAADGFQVTGFLTSCAGERAYFDPPLADSEKAAEIRRDYGLPSLDQYLASASRHCVVE
jgi:hypothetical protein